MPEKIYHILSFEELERALAVGAHAPDSLLREGFIHASVRAQVLPTWQRYYANIPDLYLLEITVSEVASMLKYEDTAGRGEKFPHIYGALPWTAVTQVYQLEAWLDKIKDHEDRGDFDRQK